MVNWNFETLLDHEYFSRPLDLGDLSKHQAIGHLVMMSKIRAAEMKLAECRKKGIIGGPVHLGIGQEAVAVGVAAHIRNSDRVFSGHRSHSHLLSLGAPIRNFFAEVLGKVTGMSCGMGGSMHLQDRNNGFYGSVPIVAGTVPLAAGAALAAKMDGDGDIAIAYLGDGAVEEGVVHETLNLISSLSVPLIVVVENNLFASHMHISLRQTQSSTARFAAANGIDYQIVDGNDVIAVSTATGNLISNARSQNKPGFIEALTYRWLGHVDWRDDLDVGVSRSSEDLENWKKRDPIKRLNLTLVKEGYLRQDELYEIQQKLAQDVDEAWEKALSDPYPLLSATADLVYAESD